MKNGVEGKGERVKSRRESIHPNPTNRGARLLATTSFWQLEEWGRRRDDVMLKEERGGGRGKKKQKQRKENKGRKRKKKTKKKDVAGSKQE